MSGERSRERPLVLVVEDNPHDWEIYGKILWYNGFDVLYAADGTEGLRLCLEHAPDLVLLDVGLPDMTGLELCSELRGHAGSASIPVVILSARPRAEYEARALRAGCTQYMEKPAGPLDVLREVERLVGRPPLPGDGRPPELGGRAA